MRHPEEGEPLPPHLSCHPWYPTCLDRRDSPGGKRKWKGNELFPATEADSEHRMAYSREMTRVARSFSVSEKGGGGGW